MNYANDLFIQAYRPNSLYTNQGLPIYRSPTHCMLLTSLQISLTTKNLTTCELAA